MKPLIERAKRSAYRSYCLPCEKDMMKDCINKDGVLLCKKFWGYVHGYCNGDRARARREGGCK